jgi:glycosyltransferase involved in cell wall biosynthesis
MRCPTLNELPPPRPGKSGWPWTEENPQILELPDSSTYPRVSLVTPNYNYGSTLEETIRSVLLQGYPNLEYIIIDGGSSDESVEVIKKYEPWLSYWESESDRGQSHAINKGFARCSGELVNWLCSDDILLPFALKDIIELFLANPDADVVAGYCRYIYAHKPGQIHVQAPFEGCLETLECRNWVAQPACFYRRSLLKRKPYVDENLHFTMDHELWCYFNSQAAKWVFVDRFFAEAHESGTNKSTVSGSRTMHESSIIYNRYVKEVIPLTFWYRWLRHPILNLRYRYRSKLIHFLSLPFHVGIILLLSPFYGRSRVRAMGHPHL